MTSGARARRLYANSHRGQRDRRHDPQATLPHVSGKGQGHCRYFHAPPYRTAQHKTSTTEGRFFGLHEIGCHTACWRCLDLRHEIGQFGKVTLISIFPYSIAYLEPSNDPIFHATLQHESNGWTIWTRSNQLASTLACVDEREFCSRSREFCWRSMEDAFRWLFRNVPDISESMHNVILLFAALERSTIYEQLIDNDAEALQVRSLLSHSGLSMKTGDWRLESEGFYQSSLARLQNEIVNIANGAFHDVPWTHNLLEPLNNSIFDWSGVCDMVLITAPGLKSVSLRGVLSILAMSLLIIIVSINPDNKLVVLDYLTRKAVQLTNFIVLLLVRAVILSFTLYRAFSDWHRSRRRIRLPTSIR